MEIALPAILFAALALDSILGEPPVRIHPVCWTGTLAVKIEKMGHGRGIHAVDIGTAVAHEHETGGEGAFSVITWS